MERSKFSPETGVARGRNGGGNRADRGGGNRGGGRRNYSHQQYRSGGERGGRGHQWPDPSNGQAVGPTRGGRSGSRVWSEGPIHSQPQPQPEFQSQTETGQQAFPGIRFRYSTERSKCSRETGVARGCNGGGNRAGGGGRNCGGGRRNYSHQQYRSGGERGGWGHQWADPSNGQGCQAAGHTRGGQSGSRVWSEGPIHLQPQPQPEFQSQTETGQQAFPDMESLEISEQKPPLTLPESTEKRIMPMKRPNKRGRLAVRSVWFFANHFPVRFNTESSIMHYDVDIKPHLSPDIHSVKKSIPKLDLCLIVDKLVSDDPTQFPNQMIVYDGEKNMFSAVPLPTRQVTVTVAGGDGTECRSYIVTIKLVNELKYSKLHDYSSGKLPYIPPDILQGMDLVMKENPSRHRICIGIAAFRGFQQGLKLIYKGVALCLGYSVIAFRNSLPVIDFLKEHVRDFLGVNDVRELRREVTFTLQGLEVTVTHCISNEKYIIIDFVVWYIIKIFFIFWYIIINFVARCFT